MNSNDRIDPSQATFFLGAGASWGAGLPLAVEFIKALFGLVITDRRACGELVAAVAANHPRARYGGDFLRFESVLQCVRAVVDPDLNLLGVYDLAESPSAMQLTLAQAAAAGARLVTVNFDDLLERAVRTTGRAVRTVDAFSRRRSGPAGPVIDVLKLHGSLFRHDASGRRRSGGELQATIEAIAAHSPGVALAPRAYGRFAEAVDGRTLVVIGYSASDDLDVVPSLAELRPLRVVWIDHRAGTPRRAASRTASGAIRHVLEALGASGAKVDLVRGDTRRALERAGFGPIANQPRASLPWHSLLEGWRSEFSHELGDGSALAAELFGELEQYERAYALGRKARGRRGRRGVQPWTPARRAETLAELVLLSERLPSGEGIRHARRAIRLARAAGDLNSEGYGLITLGRLLARAGRPDEAVARRDALALGEPGSTGRAQVAQRLANILSYAGRDAEALALLDQASPSCAVLASFPISLMCCKPVR